MDDVGDVTVRSRKSDGAFRQVHGAARASVIEAALGGSGSWRQRRRHVFIGSSSGEGAWTWSQVAGGGVLSQSCREGGCVSWTHRTSCCSRQNDVQPCACGPLDTVYCLMHLINTLCFKQRAWVQLSATEKV